MLLPKLSPEPWAGGAGLVQVNFKPSLQSQTISGFSPGEPGDGGRLGSPQWMARSLSLVPKDQHHLWGSAVSTLPALKADWGGFVLIFLVEYHPLISWNSY